MLADKPAAEKLHMSSCRSVSIRRSLVVCEVAGHWNSAFEICSWLRGACHLIQWQNSSPDV